MKEISLDARGLVCPLPVLKARKILLAAEEPLRLIIRVDDGASEKDFRLFCDEQGYRFIRLVMQPDHAEIVIEGGLR